YCVMIELADGLMAYGDCVTVLNAGYAGRPRPLRAENMPQAAKALGRLYDGKAFTGFRDSVALLDELDLEGDQVTPIAYGVSQALLSATALSRRTTMAQVLKDEYAIQERYPAPEFAGSCGGEWEQNVDKAIMRRVAMFPQSAIQTQSQCERLEEYVSWIVGRVGHLGGNGYKPDLHFDFHSSLGRMFNNDEGKICD